MKKKLMLVLMIVLLLTTAACNKTNKKFEPDNTLGSIYFRLATDSDSVDRSSKVKSTTNKMLLSSVKLNSSNPGFLIGDRPEIYFEYTRPEEFIFIEAGIERSSDPGVVFKFNNPVEDLNGYSIKTGQSWNSLVEEESFRAIITVPEIADFSVEEYILVNIKIEVAGVKLDIEIPEEDREVEVKAEEEMLWNQLSRLAVQYTTWNFNESDYEFYYLFDSLPIHERLHFKIFLEGEELEHVNKNSSLFVLPGIGDAIYNYSIQITLGGETRTYDYIFNHKTSWDNNKLTDVYDILLDEDNRELKIRMEEPYRGEDIIIHRNINSVPIELITITDTIELEPEVAVNIRLFGYADETELDLESLFSLDIPERVNIFIGDNEVPINRE